MSTISASTLTNPLAIGAAGATALYLGTTTIAALGGAYFLGMQILTNLQEQSAFQGRLNLGMHYLSCAAFAYAVSCVTYSENPESNNALASTLSTAGGFFAALRCAHTFVKGGEKQFDTLFSRSFETLAALGSAFVAVRIGIAVGITPSDALSFTASGVSFAARFTYRCVSGLWG